MFQEYEMSMIVTRSQKEYCFNISDMVFKKKLWNTKLQKLI